MTSNSNGEVFGVKAFNLAIIGMSVAIMLGVLWQPAPSHLAATKPAAQIEYIAAKTPAPSHLAG
jgi:hypothetical protein